MDRKVLESDVHKIATELSTHTALTSVNGLDRFSLSLDLSQAEIAGIKKKIRIDGADDYGHLTASLLKWISFKGQHATFGNLIAALRLEKFEKAADGIETLFEIPRIPTPEDPVNPNPSLATIERQRKFIKANLVELADNTDHWNELRNHLLAKNLISESEMQTINDMPGKTSRFTYLYIDSGLTRKPSFFQGLKESFEKTNNIIPLDILKEFN